VSHPAPAHPDLIYARISARGLRLDLYLPLDTPQPYPLIGLRGSREKSLLFIQRCSAG
jgi:hypothetical protein